MIIMLIDQQRLAAMSEVLKTRETATAHIGRGVTVHEMWGTPYGASVPNFF
jgi:hypothetical protein